MDASGEPQGARRTSAVYIPFMPLNSLRVGALVAAVAVAAGAFGAHALRTRLDPADLAIYETAVRYQMYHAFGLFMAGWQESRAESPAVRRAGWLFVAGIVLFSGSLYLLVLLNQRWLGAVTPLGGAALIAGWLSLFAAFARRTR